MTPEERAAEIDRLEQELLDLLDAGYRSYEASKVHENIRLRERIAQLRRAQELQKQIANRTRGFSMCGRSWLDAEIDNRAEGQRARQGVPPALATAWTHGGMPGYQCVNCGLTSDKEPSVKPRKTAPDRWTSYCNDCAWKAGAP